MSALLGNPNNIVQHEEYITCLASKDISGAIVSRSVAAWGAGTLIIICGAEAIKPFSLETRKFASLSIIFDTLFP